MEYVYHMVPREMKGNVLLSLNELKEPYPALYETYTKKYFDTEDRPHLLKKRIPTLDCLWNDVIFLLPLHPSNVYEGMRKLGIRVKKDVLFYKIPVERLLHNQNAVYLYSKDYYEGPSKDIPSQEIQLIDITHYPACDELPPDTYAYFDESHQKGEPFAMFAYVPHILSKGEISIEGVEIINWSATVDF